MSEANLTVADPAIVLCLFGPQDQYLRMVRNHYGVAITHRDGKVRIVGDEEAVRLATSALESLRERAAKRGQLTLMEVQAVLGVSSSEGTIPFSGSVSGSQSTASAGSNPAGANSMGSNATGSGKFPSPSPSAGRFDALESNVEVDLSHQHRKIKPRTAGQATYVSAIRAHDLTFCGVPPAAERPTWR